jgi:hypothetical protein
MGLLEPPLVIPGFDKLVLKLLLIGSVILVAGGALIISSIVGVIRALRRERRGGRSVAAVVLAAIAAAITASWLLYWVAYDIHDRSNPINILLAINFAFCLLPPDKKNISYKIRINTDKPISQVDLAVKETDDSGKVLMDTTMLWQNIVHSTQQPIEKGKTYDVQDYLYPGATKAECKLKRVVFQDGTTWSPK